MKYAPTFLSAAFILLSQEVNSFSTSTTRSSCFRELSLIKPSRNNHESPSTSAARSTQRRQDGLFPSFARTTTTLSVTPAAITGVLTGGILGGALHAIAGPDHLAALLPRCCGQRWWKAGRIGALWGMGHGVSVTILGALAFALKSQFQKAPGAKVVLSGASHLMEIAVGLSLIFIGAMGLREAKEWGEEMEALPTHSLSAAVSPSESTVKNNSNRNRALIFNGLLHGFSWDGAPSLAPALAVATWSGNLAFLSAYAAGTVGVMTIATSLVGEGTRKAGEAFNRPDLPQKLSYVTSLLAIAIGGIWCGLALKA